jgi:hypothetical protein
VPDRVLARIERQRPRSPQYLERGHRGGAQIGNRLDADHAAEDRVVERHPLVGIGDFLTNMVGDDELVAGQARAQVEPRHMHQVDEHVGVGDDNDLRRRCHRV